MEFILVALGVELVPSSRVDEADDRGLARPKMKMSDEMHSMREEALQISRQLLNEDNDVRQRAERFMDEASDRCKVYRPSVACDASAAARQPLGKDQPSVKDCALRPPLSMSATLPSLGTKCHKGFTQDDELDPVPTKYTFNGFPTAPRGDVRVYSFKRADTMSSLRLSSLLGSSCPPSAGDVEKASPMARRASVTKPQGLSLITVPQNEPNKNTDPFSDWKSTVVDVGQMSLLQLTIQSLEGQEKVMDDLSGESRRFKAIDLHRPSDSELNEYRCLYSAHGLKALRRQQARWEKRGEERRAARRRGRKGLNGCNLSHCDPDLLDNLKNMFKKVQGSM